MGESKRRNDRLIHPTVENRARETKSRNSVSSVTSGGGAVLCFYRYSIEFRWVRRSDGLQMGGNRHMQQIKMAVQPRSNWNSQTQTTTLLTTKIRMIFGYFIEQRIKLENQTTTPIFHWASPNLFFRLRRKTKMETERIPVTTREYEINVKPLWGRLRRQQWTVGRYRWLWAAKTEEEMVWRRRWRGTRWID